MKSSSDIIPSTPIDTFLPFFMIFLGGASLAIVFVVNPFVLRYFASDRSLEAVTAANSVRTVIVLGISGLLFISFGVVSRRLAWFKFLNNHPGSINMTIACLSIFWMLFVMETCLRIKPMATTAEIMSQSIAYEPATYAIHRLASFDQNIKTPGGNIQATIRRGYRGKSFQAEKPVGEKRMVIIGGSFVYDPHAAKGKDWPHRIEQILHARGFSDFKVINAGIPGHSSADAVGRLYSEIHMFQPDYVVLCNAWNDIKYFHYLSPEKTLLKNITGLKKATHHKISLPAKLLEESQLVIRVKALIRRINHANIGFEGNLPDGELLDYFDEWGLKQYRLNLATFIDICRNIGAEPILLPQPRLVAKDNSDEEKERIKYQYVLLNHDALRRAFSACDSEMRNAARTKNAMLFDIANLMNGQSRYFETHVHLSNLGSQKFAEAIVELLLKNGLISS